MFEHADSFCFNLCSWVDSCKPPLEFDTNSLKAAVNDVTSYPDPNTKAVFNYGGGMNCWDVSSVSSMYQLFYWNFQQFNVNIARWNTDKVTDMDVSLFQFLFQ